MTVITIYTSPECHLCAEALSTLRHLQAELGRAGGHGDLRIAERDITADEALHRRYFERIPVVELDGEELCEYVVDERFLRERLANV